MNQYERPSFSMHKVSQNYSDWEGKAMCHYSNTIEEVRKFYATYEKLIKKIDKELRKYFLLFI